ncbi:LLM class flavin-dependent oxidoreductase [Paenarthrobacter nicotinovorans]|uniref:LLM class flavin-dependent oxidoreductase n=1 Tax=Paenarthrobacter nicotinovorans TaxID=29320 RepID=UPI00166E3FB4|nr:LLM class flavin-dependent oxidoreductase [Paenarthrobacter nicotinovorans]MBP2394997.1 alkanesulfonate monooxygenase SsuD/methylene tetrahydromethanopterin reductase-like flavin-dependent oxidoreductase (luciferase family) [Paenarthrobacter nicotinovorans]UKE98845.1 LLM class flavin-dependent oxidoreductase [Paenarthrobacter nicotinovorans]UKF03634.1 LLM class flavin-dependent oxidoreductase [Paenarthrobacter nicotinovorans]GGV37698.1 FMNH2-utilizing oxygenase [Paenarthrobacter nicotinovora
MSIAKKAGFLAIELDGAGYANLARAVLDAESAGFHAATFKDTPEAGRANALQRAAFAGPITRTIAVVPEVDTVYTEPFHISTQLASLDYVSGGRAGWIATAAESPEAAAAVGRSFVTGNALAQEAAASIEAGRRLWDSWEDDAVIRDVATGRYLDVDKLHYVDFETPADFSGTPYSVKGPSIIPRPLQGQLPVLAAAKLVGEGQVPVEAVDAVLVSAPTPELLTAEIRDVRARLGGSVAIVAELDVILDARGQSAASRPVASPEAALSDSERARYTGPADGLIELLEVLLAEADGVRLHPAALEVELEELSRLVLPELRRRGSVRPPVLDGTFRDVLGLERPQSRYSTSAAAVAAGKQGPA